MHYGEMADRVRCQNPGLYRSEPGRYSGTEERADGDGIISISDATTVQRHLAELELLDGIYLLAADVNQDGVIDISDATTLQMYLADYPLQYPIGEGLRISNSLNLKQT